MYWFVMVLLVLISAGGGFMIGAVYGQERGGRDEQRGRG